MSNKKLLKEVEKTTWNEKRNYLKSQVSNLLTRIEKQELVLQSFYNLCKELDEKVIEGNITILSMKDKTSKHYKMLSEIYVEDILKKENAWKSKYMDYIKSIESCKKNIKEYRERLEDLLNTDVEDVILPEINCISSIGNTTSAIYDEKANNNTGGYYITTV